MKALKPEMKPRIPFMVMPEEVHEAAQTLHNYFEKQGVNEWQFRGVADRRLVERLEQQVKEAMGPGLTVQRKRKTLEEAIYLKRIQTTALNEMMNVEHISDSQREAVMLRHSMIAVEWVAMQEELDRLGKP